MLAFWPHDTCCLWFLLVAGSGDSSIERDFSGALGGPTVSTPNSKEASPSRSLSGQWTNKCNFHKTVNVAVTTVLLSFRWHIISPRHFCLCCVANSIKVELYSDEDIGRGAEDERGDRQEDGASEQGSEAVGSYRELTNSETMPAGATRLPNGKLTCDICGMICIGPNVLMVHKRSHTGDLSV